MASVTVQELQLSIAIPAESQAAASADTAPATTTSTASETSSAPRAAGRTATIRDLKLDPDTLDIVVEGGDVVLIEDADVVAQHLRLRLKTQLREWYLDQTSGVDYIDGVAPKGAAREAIIRDKITTVPHVRGLASFASNLDAATRVFSVEFTAQTDFGDVTVAVEAP